MKTIAMVLMVSVSLLAKTDITEYQRTGSVAKMVVVTDYRMSDRDTLEEVRYHVLDQQKQYAAEYAGSLFIVQNKAEFYGDASITDNERYIARITEGVSSSKILEESRIGDVYVQKASIEIDTGKVDEAVLMEMKIRSMLTHGKHSVVERGDVPDIKVSDDLADMKSKTLARFGKAYTDNMRFGCQLNERVYEKNDVRDIYKCTLSGDSAEEGNYLEYYRADICSYEPAIAVHIAEREVKEISEYGSSSSVKITANIVYGAILPCKNPNIAREEEYVERVWLPGYDKGVLVALIHDGRLAQKVDFMVEHTHKPVVEGYSSKFWLQRAEYQSLPLMFGRR